MNTVLRNGVVCERERWAQVVAVLVKRARISRRAKLKASTKVTRENSLDTKLPVSFGGLGSAAPGEGDTGLLIPKYLGDQWPLATSYGGLGGALQGVFKAGKTLCGALLGPGIVWSCKNFASQSWDYGM